MGGSKLLLGLRFDPVTSKEALERMLVLAEEARKGGLPARLVVTVNVQILVTARHRCHELLSIINSAPLVVADGAPIVYLSRLFGPRLPERVAGSDLIYDIVAASEQKGLKVFFLGGEEKSTSEAVEAFLKMHPELKVAGVASPAVALCPRCKELAEEENICRCIRDSGTDVLLVGLGCPKQELFISRNAKRLPGMVAIGLGGSFNFVSGRVRRAPPWMRRVGLEWIYRIIQEPRRLFMRYFSDAFFLAGYVISEAARRAFETVKVTKN